MSNPTAAATLTSVVANTLHYRDLPDFVVWAAACECVERSIERAAPEAVV